jgi:choline-sulfatase
MKTTRLMNCAALPLLLLATACSPDPEPDPGTDPDPVPPGPVDPDPIEPVNPDSPLNVVYIMTDQQSYYMLSGITGELGSDPYADIAGIKTPNLDRLVRRGYAFSNCYAAQNVSGPSRFALLTGESPNGWGMYNNYVPKAAKGTAIQTMVKERAMGQLFKKAGYNTVYGGKTHLPFANGSTGNINGEPSGYGFETYLTDHDRKGTPSNGFNGQGLPEKAVEFIESYDEEKPFLLFLSFMNPHDICMSDLIWGTGTGNNATGAEVWARANQYDWRAPFNAAGGLAAFADDTPGVKLPANRGATTGFGITDAARNKPNQNFDADNFRKWRAHIWFYYGLMEQADSEIGMVLDALEASPYADNTLIIFTSDHGEMAGSHGFEGKMLPYEEAQRVPFVFCGPSAGIPEGVVDNLTLVCNGWDLLPTMLDFADIEIPAQLAGLSLRDFMTEGTPLNRQYLYMETTQSYGVADGRYKYTRFFIPPAADFNNPPYTLDNNHLELLIDLREDPGELTNLAKKPEHAATLSRLRGALAQEMAKYGTTL